jgi:hypothetical protein
MTSPWARRAAIIITATATLAVLAACTPMPTPTAPGSTTASGTSAPTATPTPTPTATISSLDQTPPAALLNLSCNDLGATASIAVAYPNTPLVTNPDVTAGDLANNTNAIPIADYIRADGGIVCLWDKTGDNNYRFEGRPNPSFEITVIFNAAAAWTKNQTIGLAQGDTAGSCDVGVCQGDQFINGNTWLDILELEPVSAGQENAFVKSLKKSIAAIKAAGTPATLPAQPAGTLALGTQCPDFIANSAVQTALGSGTVVSNTPAAYLEDPYTYSTWDGAQDGLNDHPCVWKVAGKKVGSLSWVPGGAWAWTDAQSHPQLDGPAKPLAVPGLPDGDGAWVRCSPSGSSCTTDLVIGGDWIEANLAKTGPASKLAAITAIATGIVAKLG